MPYMATRPLLTLAHTLTHNRAQPPPSVMMSSTSSGSKRRSHPARRDFSSTHGNQRSRPPKHPNNPKSRPTHFLALPIGHHAELRDAVSALTSSWLAHEPPIEGLDPSIVINPRRVHLTLGVMTLASSQPSSSSNPDRDHNHEATIDLAGATTLLASLAPRIRALLANNPLRIPLGRLAIMQPDPARAHVLYVEPDLRSPDGRRLRAVCGTFPSFLFFFSWIPPSFMFHPPPGRMFGESLIGYRSRPWSVQGSWLSRRCEAAQGAPPSLPIITCPLGSYSMRQSPSIFFSMVPVL